MSRRKRIMAVAAAGAMLVGGLIGSHTGASLVARVSPAHSTGIILAGDVYDLGIFGACRDSGGSIAECREISKIP